MNSPAVHVRRNTLMLHWDKPEDVMNKLMTAAVVAGGLMLLNSPEAAAHQEARNMYQLPAHYRAYAYVDVRRPKHMPSWMKRDKGFKYWYRHSSLKRNWRLGWHQLFEIYRFERRFGRTYSRSDNYWNDYYEYRHRDRHHDGDKRRKRRHRH